MSEAPARAGAAPDPLAILRSKSFIAVLLLAAVIGVVVSFVSWAFLEFVHYTQQWLFTDLPDDFGWDSIPPWWYLLVLGVAGLPVALAIVRMPGSGGHVPAHGLQMGGTEPSIVAGVVLAGWASIGFGLVLGPEAPLITVGAGLAMYTVHLVRRDAQPQLVTVLAAAGSLAAISVIFGSPIVSAVLVVEAAGLGGSTLPLIVVPGLIAAGVGSLVFIGMSHWSGLSTTAYALAPIELPQFSKRHLGGDRLGDRDGARRGAHRLCHHGSWGPGVPAGSVVAVRAHPARRARRCGTGNPVRADDRPRSESGALLRSGCPARTGVRRRHVVSRCPAHADRLQGTGVGRVDGRLPRRTDVPRHLPRCRGRDRRLPPPRLLPDRRHRGRHRRHGRGRAEVAALGDRHRDGADGLRRPRRWARSSSSVSSPPTSPRWRCRAGSARPDRCSAEPQQRPPPRVPSRTGESPGVSPASDAMTRLVPSVATTGPLWRAARSGRAWVRCVGSIAVTAEPTVRDGFLADARSRRRLLITIISSVVVFSAVDDDRLGVAADDGRRPRQHRGGAQLGDHRAVPDDGRRHADPRTAGRHPRPPTGVPRRRRGPGRRDRAVRPGPDARWRSSAPGWSSASASRRRCPTPWR